MRIIRGIYDFWYDFIIGDDWKIAVAVLTVLVIGAAVVLGGSYNAAVLTVLLALGVAVTFVAALLIDIRMSAKG